MFTFHPVLNWRLNGHKYQDNKEFVHFIVNILKTLENMNHKKNNMAVKNNLFIRTKTEELSSMWLILVLVVEPTRDSVLYADPPLVTVSSR